jgi:son of sevenless-like protein
VFSELQALFSTSGNFKTYRATIAACTPPALPYVGLSLQDLTFLETNKDTKVVATMTMVNLEKWERISAVLFELNRFQSVPFPLRSMPVVQTYLMRGKNLSSGEQDALSAVIRPKTMATDGQGGTTPRRFWKKEFGSSPRPVE